MEKIIPNVLEAMLFPRLVKDQDLPRLIQTLTIEVLGFIDLLGPEVAEA